ncbi:TPM domain-containing protein [Paenibacillus wenxiniae]|uniref:TPM domain-containing protein n=1 Tax=Paenibacillus wenxiniae TaxID=1636843 RepID=A0ABW4RM31_9BACL
MERLFRFVYRIILCLLIASAVLPAIVSDGASASPYFKQHVKDDAGLFTDKDLGRMNRALANHHYKLYVITASGYTEEAGMKLVDQLYDEFGLGSNELLLLITTNPNFVHMAFKNDELAARITASRAGSVRGVTDTQFVPYAKNGDVAGGVIAISEYINGLGPVSGEDVQAADAEEGTLSPATSDIAQLTGQQSENLHYKRQLVLQIGAAVLILLLLATGAFLLRQLSTRRKLLRRRTAIQRRINKIEHRLAVLLESDALNADILASGGSKDKSMLQSQLRQESEQQLAHTEQCRSTVRTIRLPLLSLSRARLELGRLEHDLLLVEEQLVPLEQQHALLHGTVPAEVLATVNPSSTIAAETNKLAEDEGQQQLTALYPDAAYDLDWLANELEAQIAHEGLYTGGEENPLALLERARTDQQRMRKLQTRGDRDGALAAKRTLDRHIQQAQRLLQDMLRFREQAMHVSEEAERTIEEYESLSDWHAREWARLEGHYAVHHLHEQQERYDDMKHLLQRIERLCPQIAHNLLGKTPHYGRAYEDSLQISAAIQRLQEQRLALLSYPEELDLRKKLDMERWEALSSHHRDIASRLSELPLDHLQVEPVQEQSFQSLEQARLLLLEEPIDLHAAEQALEVIEQHLELLIRQFETVDATMRLDEHNEDVSSMDSGEQKIDEDVGKLHTDRKLNDAE